MCSRNACNYTTRASVGNRSADFLTWRNFVENHPMNARTTKLRRSSMICPRRIYTKFDEVKRYTTKSLAFLSGFESTNGFLFDILFEKFNQTNPDSVTNKYT